MKDLFDILRGIIVAIVGIIMIVNLETTLNSSLFPQIIPISIILIIVGTLSAIIGFLFKKIGR